MPTEPAWLRWGRELQAIAQIGLEYSRHSHFDVERYSRVRELAAAMIASNGSVGEPAALEAFTRQDGYATPKIDIRGVLFRDDRILLVREVSDGAWTLPGGWADVNETPSQCVEREVREESGFDCCAVKLLAVYDRSRHDHVPPFAFHVYKLFVLCEITGGAAGTSAETNGAAFFGEHDLPPLSLSRVTPRQIGRMFEHRRHPDWPADLD